MSERLIIHTYKQSFKADTLMFELAKESGRIYTKAMKLNKIKHKDFSEINEIMQQFCKKNCKFLHSQSAQASYQAFIVNLKAYFKALKQFNRDPSKFSGKPKPPKKNKFLYKITFKKAAIRRKDNELWLSTKKPNEPIRIKWAKHLPIPIWVTINYDKYEGWNINFILEKKYKQLELNHNEVMSIDLGVKRVATTFDTPSKETITYNGKALMSLDRLRNKVDGKIKSKKSEYKRGGRKHKKISRAKRKIVKRIKNKEKDILHRFSRMIVNDAIDKDIGKIIIGDNASTHKDTNLGKINNQKITQGVEQQLRKYIQYKFESVGGTTEVVPEAYTSRTCPKCDNVKSSSPKGRTYVCHSHSYNGECDFAFDRDGVGAINILKKNVSFDPQWWSDVVGGLTPPKGVKYTPGLSLIQSLNKVEERILNDCQDHIEIDNTLSALAIA